LSRTRFAPLTGPAVELAPAKVNLFLHVGPLRPDGYHPVASWMVFADIGDQLTLEPAPAWTFAVEGPFAAAIGGDNLVQRAADALAARARAALPPAGLTLAKRLPVAAGLGGGSSDAGAALRLLNARLQTPLPEVELLAVAARLGADGPACLLAAPVLGTGRGDDLAPAPETPPLPAVLVNPGRPSPTGAVYRAYDARPARTADAPLLAARFGEPVEVADRLSRTRNDLEAPACALEPGIAEVLAALRARPEVLLARMSGSGATCFALCATAEDAAAAAAALEAAHPDWWVRPCSLGQPITKS